MTEPSHDPYHTPTPGEEEYQDPHFHDEELEIQADDANVRHIPRPSWKKKVNRRPPPKRRFYED